MSPEEIKNIIENTLKEMGCTEIAFLDFKDDLIVAVFNCKEITSFVKEIVGWTHSGIQLDNTKSHQYKIDFKKVTDKII